MDHREYRHIVPGAQVAVLFLHGIVSTPRHFDPFLPLIPEGVSVRALLLDGHGKSVRDFGRTSMKRWEAQVQEAIEELCRNHEKLYLVGHSMGTLFSICHAVNNRKIAGLFLLASPLKVFVRPKAVSSSLRICFDCVHTDDVVALATKRDTSIQLSKNPFLYIRWIPRFLELFGKIRRTRRELKKLQVPAFFYQSAKDELVSIRSVKYLRSNPHITVHTLKNSTHSYYEAKDLEFLLEEFQSFTHSL